ncbi:MAG: hypothetical protein ACT4O1_14975 [Gemmatimonadota bacterium]
MPVRTCLILALGCLPAAAACSTKAPPPAPQSADARVVLTIENLTDRVLGVYLVEHQSHTRLGTVAARAHVHIPVRAALLGERSSFRVYAFRGAEACPVARFIDLRFSTQPRITVTAADTVLSGYLPADACRLKSQ